MRPFEPGVAPASIACAAPAAPATLPGAVGAVDATQRLAAIDILRGLALFGVLVVNLVTEFRVSIFAQFGPPEPAGALDRAVLALVHYGLEGKAFALFSLLFGMGLALQYERLARTGKPLVWMTRRLLVLLGLGLVHLLLIWNGDILTEYALAGLLVLPMLPVLGRARAGPAILALAACAMFALYLAPPMLALPAALAWPQAGALSADAAMAGRVYGAGSWLAVTQFSWHELRLLLPLHVYVFPRTLGLFLLGMLIWRSGVLHDPARHRVALVRTATLAGALGLALTLADAGGLLAASGPWSSLPNAAPVCLALAVTATVVHTLGASPARTWLRVFAPLGRMAFTHYLVQSLVFGWVFFGYGLGQFGRLQAAPVLAGGVMLYSVQLAASAWWLRRYRFGPVEWLWRSLMYGRRQPMRRAP